MPPGARPGLGELVRLTAQDFNICYRFTGQRTRAEDMTQECFCACIARWASSKQSREPSHLDDERDAQFA